VWYHGEKWVVQHVNSKGLLDLKPFCANRSGEPEYGIEESALEKKTLEEQGAEEQGAIPGCAGAAPKDGGYECTEAYVEWKPNFHSSRHEFHRFFGAGPRADPVPVPSDVGGLCAFLKKQHLFSKVVVFMNLLAIVPLLLYLITAPAVYPSDPDSDGNPVNCTWSKIGGSPAERTTRCRDMPVILLNTVVGLWLPFWVLYMLACWCEDPWLLTHLRLFHDDSSYTDSSYIATYIHEMHNWDGGTSAKPGLLRLDVYPPLKNEEVEVKASEQKPKGALGKLASAIGGALKATQKHKIQRKARMATNAKDQAFFVKRCKQVGGECPPLSFHVSCSHEETVNEELVTVTTFSASFPLTWRGSAKDDSSSRAGVDEEHGGMEAGAAGFQNDHNLRETLPELERLCASWETRPLMKVNSSWVVSDGGEGSLASVEDWLWNQHQHRDDKCQLTLQAKHAMPLVGSPGFGNGSVRVSSMPFKSVQSVKVGEFGFLQGLFLSSGRTAFWLATIFSMNIPYKLWFEKQTSTLNLVFGKVYTAACGWPMGRARVERERPFGDLGNRVIGFESKCAHPCHVNDEKAHLIFVMLLAVCLYALHQFPRVYNRLLLVLRCANQFQTLLSNVNRDLINMRYCASGTWRWGRFGSASADFRLDPCFTKLGSSSLAFLCVDPKT
jgi:hypothetical protein